MGIDVYIIRIFEYIRISYANIRIPISAFVDIPTKNAKHFKNLTQCANINMPEIIEKPQNTSIEVLGLCVDQTSLLIYPDGVT